jgi:hypothetical protein
VPRVGRIDHVVERQEGRDIDGLAVLVELVHQFLVAGIACFGIVDGGELVALAQLHCTLEAHGAELAVRQATANTEARWNEPPPIAIAPRP